MLARLDVGWDSTFDHEEVVFGKDDAQRFAFHGRTTLPLPSKDVAPRARIGRR